MPVFSSKRLRDEELIIDGKIIFKFDFVSNAYNVDNLAYIKAETANIDRYLESLERGAEMEEGTASRLPFFRWLFNNMALEECNGF